MSEKEKNLCVRERKGGGIESLVMTSKNFGICHTLGWMDGWGEASNDRERVDAVCVRANKWGKLELPGPHHRAVVRSRFELCSFANPDIFLNSLSLQVILGKKEGKLQIRKRSRDLK